MCFFVNTIIKNIFPFKFTLKIKDISKKLSLFFYQPELEVKITF